MLTFDALIGHNDRHPYNWGVIVPIHKNSIPRFAPVYDTARALFWNISEEKIRRMLKDRGEFESYVRRCAAPIDWDGEQGIDFFRLIGLIWRSSPQYQKHIEKFLDEQALARSVEMLEKEFIVLMSAQRRELIEKCLHFRRQFEGSMQRMRKRSWPSGSFLKLLESGWGCARRCMRRLTCAPDSSSPMEIC
jgi:hypothetical protein